MDLFRNTLSFIFILFLSIVATGLLIPVAMQQVVSCDLGNSCVIDDVLLGSGFIYSLSPTFIIFSPIMGFVSDLIGTKKVICFSLISFSIGFFLLIVSTKVNILLFFLGLVFFGIGYAVLPLTLAALAETINTQKRIYPYAISSAILFTMVPFALGGNLLLSKYINNVSVLFIALLLTSIALLIGIFGIKKSHTKKYSNSNFRLIRQLISCLKLFKNKDFLLSLILFSLFIFSWGLYDQYLFFFLENEIGFDMVSFNYFVICSCLLVMFGALIVFPVLIKFITIGYIIIKMFLITGISLLVWSFISSYFLQWLFEIPVALGIGILLPSFLTKFSNLSSNRQYGLVMGIVCSLLALLWMIGGLVGTVLLRLPNIEINFLLAGVILLSCSLIGFYRKC